MVPNGNAFRILRLQAITIISAVLGNEIPNKREPKLLKGEGLVLAAVDGGHV